MNISLQYSRVEAVKYRLDQHDLHRAVREFIQRDRYFPKDHTDIEVDFGDDEEDRPFCDVVVKIVRDESPQSLPADPATSEPEPRR